MCLRERSPNTTRTSRAIFIRKRGREDARAIGRPIIDTHNGDAEGGDGKVELQDVLVIETTDGKKYEFEVVGLVEDDENNAFAVAYSEAADEFVVTDYKGTLLDNDALAQEILDDFFVLAEESATEEN